MKKIKLLAIVPAILLLFTGCGVNYKELEAKFEKDAKAMYERDIRNTNFNIPNIPITLSDLEAAKYDVKEFEDANCDKDKSIVLITATLDEKGKAKDGYKVDTKLVCDKYTTGEEK